MASWTQWLNSPAGAAAAPAMNVLAPCDVGELREHILALLSDCDGVACERVRDRLRRAGSANDLWHARSDVFDVLAIRHCESQAVQRVSTLAPLFQRSR